MDKIYVTGMRFYGNHGVFPEETRLGQRFNVDVTVQLPLAPAGTTDDLTKSVNYADIYAVCQRVVEGEPKQLIESVAEAIAQALLAEFALVQECTVKLYKPDPPIRGHYDYVAVEITRGRTV